MRLLLIATSYPSKRNPSSGIFVHLLAKSLKDIGHDIKVITPADNEKHGFKGDKQLTNGGNGDSREPR